MKTRPSRGRRLPLLTKSCAVALAVAVVAPLGVVMGPGAVPTAWAAAGPEVRKELADLINAANSLLKQNKAEEALAKLRETDSMQKSPYEKGVIEQLTLGAALRAGNVGLAARTFDSVSPLLNPSQTSQYVLAISGLYLQAKNYPEAITWANRYISAGGSDVTHARAILLAAYQATGDYQKLQSLTLEAISQSEKAGTAPPENDLDMLLFTSDKLKDAPHYGAALEKLVAYYPTPDNWLRLILDVTKRPNFSHAKLELDVLRLEFATGNLKRPDQYEDFLGMGIQANLPSEVKTVIDKGFDSKVLGTGPEAARQNRFRDLIARKLDEAQKAEAAREAEAKAAPTGDLAVDIGMAYYGSKTYDQAISWMEQGLAKGGLKNPDLAKLHLGIVYLAAGQKAKASDALKSVKQADGTADLARMWLLKAGARS